VLHTIKALPPPKPSVLTRFRHACYDIYMRLAQSQRITKAIIFFLLFQSVSLMLAMSLIFLQKQTLSFTEWGNLISYFYNICCQRIAVSQIFKGEGVSVV
jgi:hypothetical protein